MKEKLFMPLSNDLLFKETLSHIENRDKLVYYLKVTTGLEEDAIQNNLRVKYESVLDKSKLKEKNMRGDIVIEFDKYKVNLECYSYFDKNSFDKSTSYIMRIFSTQLDSNHDYLDLDTVIQINIIDNIHTSLSEDAVSEYYITNSNNINDKILADKFKIKYYRIDKAREIPYNELDEEMRWIRFIGAKSAEERALVAKGDEKLMELNDWVEEYVNDEKTKHIFGEWAEVIAEEKGKAMGREDTVIEIAKNMLQEGSTKEFISKVTGLTIEEIENLQD